MRLIGFKLAGDEAGPVYINPAHVVALLPTAKDNVTDIQANSGSPTGRTRFAVEGGLHEVKSRLTEREG